MRRLIRLQGSVFTRFVAAFLLAIMPICAIGVTLYNWQIRLLDNTTVEAFGTAAKHGFDKVENELDKVKTLSYAVLADEDLLALANSGMIMDNYQKTVSMNRYIRRMENLQDPSYLCGLRKGVRSGGSSYRFEKLGAAKGERRSAQSKRRRTDRLDREPGFGIPGLKPGGLSARGRNQPSTEGTAFSAMRRNVGPAITRIPSTVCSSSTVSRSFTLRRS